MPKRFVLPALFCFVVSAPVYAQYGGPLGGGGIPVPWGHKKKQQKSDPNAPTISADGKTVSNDGKTLVVDVPDGAPSRLSSFLKRSSHARAAVSTKAALSHAWQCT